MKDQLLTLAIQELPDFIALIKAKFRAQHPGLPEPTSEEIIVAYQDAYVASLAKDDRWRAAHPGGVDHDPLNP